MPFASCQYSHCSVQVPGYSSLPLHALKYDFLNWLPAQEQHCLLCWVLTLQQSSMQAKHSQSCRFYMGIRNSHRLTAAGSFQVAFLAKGCLPFWELVWHTSAAEVLQWNKAIALLKTQLLSNSYLILCEKPRPRYSESSSVYCCFSFIMLRASRNLGFTSQIQVKLVHTEASYLCKKRCNSKFLPLAFVSTCPFTYKACLRCKRFTEVWQQFNKVKSKRQKNSTFSSCHKHDRTTKTIPFSAFSFQ